MSESPHPAALPNDELLSRCDLTRKRGSGPGGQHRNKVETAVVIEHRPSGLRGEASERRSQAENRRVALFRLRVNLALGVRTTERGSDEPSPLWKSRIQNRRIVVNPAHDDFPALLAEALDRVTACSQDVKQAADELGCSTSQLIRFLKLEPRALEQVNSRRVELGLRPLK